MMNITKACKTAYYHPHNIRGIRKYSTQEATCSIILAFVRSQIDYGNSLLNGLPAHLIQKLQRVQNTAARVVYKLRKYDHITPALISLHWLPVRYRIEFKTLLLVFKGLHGVAPIYITEMLDRATNSRFCLRSNNACVLRVPKCNHNNFGKRAFAVCGPMAWNALPSSLRSCDEMEIFKRTSSRNS